jgi:FtsP/CotA-like multicopper oxidase with cupredoxin domain
MRRRTFLSLLGLAPVAAVPHTRFNVPADGVQTPPLPPGALTPDVELVLTAARGEVPLLPGAATEIWRYTATAVRGPDSLLQAMPDSYLGPVVRVHRGQRVRIRFRNDLDEPSIVHWHGLDVPELADGHPRLAVGPGGEYVYDFTVTNRAGTYWYHPHPHMRTGAQVYHGLAGVLCVSDPDEEALGLPSGDGELLWVLQDRRFDARNQLVYAGTAVENAQSPGPGRGRFGRGAGGGMAMGRGGMAELMNGWLGDRTLVNGRVQPTVEVDRRTYRARLLNASNARIYKLTWSDGSPFTIIGSDGGLLEEARTRRYLTLAPGQRADVLLDLSAHAAGTTLALESAAFPADHVGRVGMLGDSAVPQGAPLTLITLRVSGRQGARFRPPARLSAHDPPPAASVPVRRVPLVFMGMRWMIDGRVFGMQDVAAAEIVDGGSTHIWEFVNQPNPMGMEMAHPMHLHGRQFRVLSRQGGSSNALREGIQDLGWTDTVLVLPGETVRVQVTFSNHPGLYLYHCHNLEHEDMGMMRNFRITARRT